jgi:hypothetical protein
MNPYKWMVEVELESDRGMTGRRDQPCKRYSTPKDKRLQLVKLSPSTNHSIYIPHRNFVEALKELQPAACIKRRSNCFDFLWRDTKNGQRYTDHSRKGLFFWLSKVAKHKVRAGMTLSRSKSTKGDKDSNEIKSAVDRPKGVSQVSEYSRKVIESLQ